MSRTVTKLPLHEVVLKIMFFENMEKAAAMRVEDILWKIDNPEISERQIREVLEWLVNQKKVEHYLGKYSIERIEFLEQKELHEMSVAASSVAHSNRSEKQKTFYMDSRPDDKWQNIQMVLLFLGVLVLGYLTYTFLDLDYSFKANTELGQHDDTQVINTIGRQKRLYTSDDEWYTESVKNAIMYSFGRQNTINNLTVKELNRLQFVVDSISKSHKTELLSLQTELETTVAHSNTFLKKLMYSNIIVILLVLVLYFKK